MKKPIAIDLYCGLGGWTNGLLAEGWDVIGFDIERHAYGDHGYPAQLVLQDVRTIHGAQFKDASLIVASSPCQEFSYRAMPWKRAKSLPPPVLGMELFAQAARIQREAIEASTCWACADWHITAYCDACQGTRQRFIPMIQENVRGAQKYVGRARWHYGSFYLWGDVPALMPITLGRAAMKVGIAHRSDETNFHGFEHRICRYLDSVNGLCGHELRFHAFEEGLHFCRVCVGTGAMHRFSGADRATKNSGGSWFNVAHNTESGTNNNPARGAGVDGAKQTGISGERTNGKGDRWFQDGAASHGSKFSARKAASARIAMIPPPLARHIARVYFPKER